MGRQVVITAMGVVSSLGNDPQAIAQNFSESRTAFRQAEPDPLLTVCPIADFEVRRYTGRHKNLRYLNRGAALAVAAALQTIKNLDPSDLQLANTGLFVGGGPNLDLGGEAPEIRTGKIQEENLAALWMLRFLPNTAASTIAQLLGLHGENLTLGTACTASLQAVGEAFRKIRDGYLDTALAGGGDSRLSPGALLAYAKAQALYCGSKSPMEASRPFDCLRQGFVPGEGAAFFLLEEASHAVARQAPILAEILGYGASLDGYAMTAPQPDGRWAELAVRRAVDQAGLSPDRIDAISAHGTGTPLNDEMEADLLARLYGSRPYILAFKSWIGHLAAACGAVELALALSMLQGGFLPPIRNLDEPCRPDLNFVRRPVRIKPRALVLQNFGFGGQNAALVIRPWLS
jgi:3-oxoacyl-[acyl-carrier-protein] synthase II